MIGRRAIVAGLAGALALGGCAPGIPRYDGPPVTLVEVRKSTRELLLWNGEEVLRRYRIQLGFAPEGHKLREGDGRTPEGRYRIDRKNPRSRYHLSLGISYPSPRDVARARAAGVDPGGDIFIHGQPNGAFRPRRGDWTAGCIALPSNAEIRQIYAMVPVGTPVIIRP